MAAPIGAAISTWRQDVPESSTRCWPGRVVSPDTRWPRSEHRYRAAAAAGAGARLGPEFFAPTMIQDDLAEPESEAGFGGAEFFSAEIRPFRPKFESKRSKPAKLNSYLSGLWPQSWEKLLSARNRRVHSVLSSTCLRIVTARGSIFTDFEHSSSWLRNPATFI